MKDEHDLPDNYEAYPVEYAHAGSVEGIGFSQSQTAPSTKQTLHDLNVSFEAFKHANDERLEQIERCNAEDVVTKNKLEKLEAQLSHLSQNLRRPYLGETHYDGMSSGAMAEQKAAFAGFLKTGMAMPTPTSSLETRAIHSTTGADGGYLIPEIIDREVGHAMEKISVMRSVAAQVQLASGSDYRKIYQNGEMEAEWVVERGARNLTDTPQMKELVVPTHEMHASPAATSLFIDDAAIDVADWFFKSVTRSFANLEDDAFLNGNGTTSPKGILTYQTEQNTKGKWDRLFVLKSGHSSGLKSDKPTDVLIDLIYSLDAQYRQNSHWMLNQSTMSVLRKLRDSNGDYIWSPPVSADQLPSLFGYPVLENANMPNMASGKVPVLFGDFNSAYVIVDRLGTQVLRDPYLQKPYVCFYTIRRVGGGLQDFAALHGLKISS